jgi:hypothetical protein
MNTKMCRYFCVFLKLADADIGIKLTITNDDYFIFFFFIYKSLKLSIKNEKHKRIKIINKCALVSYE